jgi:hypothetical protein
MKMEKQNLVQHCAIKFCVKLNENATETYEKLKRAHGEHALSRAQVFRWHTAFLDGRETMEDEPCSGRPCMSKTDENVTKVRVLCIVHKEFMPQGQTVNKQYYREVLERLRKRVHHVRPETADTRCCIVTMLCHTAISMTEFLTKRGIPVVLQPPYTPDLSPCDFFLFLKLNFTSKVIILELWTTSQRSRQSS